MGVLSRVAECGRGLIIVGTGGLCIVLISPTGGPDRRSMKEPDRLEEGSITWVTLEAQ